MSGGSEIRVYKTDIKPKVLKNQLSVETRRFPDLISFRIFINNKDINGRHATQTNVLLFAGDGPEYPPEDKPTHLFQDCFWPSVSFKTIQKSSEILPSVLSTVSMPGPSHRRCHCPPTHTRLTLPFRCTVLIFIPLPSNPWNDQRCRGILRSNSCRRS